MRRKLAAFRASEWRQTVGVPSVTVSLRSGGPRPRDQKLAHLKRHAERENNRDSGTTRLLPTTATPVVVKARQRQNAPRNIRGLLAGGPIVAVPEERAPQARRVSPLSAALRKNWKAFSQRSTREPSFGETGVVKRGVIARREKRERQHLQSWTPSSCMLLKAQ